MSNRTLELDDRLYDYLLRHSLREPEALAALRAETASHPQVNMQIAPSQRRASMTWAQRLKRVFRIEIEICRRCGGRLRVIASRSRRHRTDSQSPRPQRRVSRSRSSDPGAAAA
jgi:predicted O-methyltransferase YrrM